MSKHKKKKKWYRLLFLHRYTGLSAALFAILLSITGILLNHTQELGLHSRNVSASWLMELYGIKSPDIQVSYALKRDAVDKAGKTDKNTLWVVEFAGSIYLNNLKLDCEAPLMGAIRTDELLLISAPAHICLFTDQAELVDLLAANEGTRIRRLGKNKAGRIIVGSSAGLFVINPDFTELVSHQGANTGIEWMSPGGGVPDSIASSLKQQYKGAGLPLERVILDLHSGRIVGLLGVYFMDLIALLLIFLSVSGVIVWVKRKIKKKSA